MNMHTVHVTAFIIVIVNWIVFAAFFLFQKKPPRQQATKRERLSIIAIHTLGTAIRVRSEEKLLRAQFGAEYEDYARRVPAILPWRLGR